MIVSNDLDKSIKQFGKEKNAIELTPSFSSKITSIKEGVDILYPAGQRTIVCSTKAFVARSTVIIEFAFLCLFYPWPLDFAYTAIATFGVSSLHLPLLSIEV
jgi:hypothetical protein